MLKQKSKEIFLIIFIGIILFSLSCKEMPTDPTDDNGGVEPYEGKIVFSSRRGGSDTYNLFTMNPDGTNIKQLTFGNYDYSMPRWSPDGTKIVFTTDSSATTLGASLFIMNADGTNIRPVKQDSVWTFPQPGYWPSWSPDGKKIVFSWCASCEVGGLNSEIYVVDLETEKMKQLTNDPHSDYAPDWSPDGKKIVFLSRRDYPNSAHNNIYLMNSDGTKERKISCTDNAYYGFPTYSKDADILTQVNLNIVLVDYDCNEKVLLPADSMVLSIGGPLRWGPENKKIIALQHQNTYDSYIVIFDTLSKEIKRIIDDPTVKWPDW